MTVTLLEELQEGEYQAAFFLTYTLSLSFFESLVLPRLRRLGVAHIGILTDDKGYQDSLENPLASEECGRSYVIAPARLPGRGIQHAKLLWLKGSEHVVYIGSHNLTMAGYNDQTEVTAKLSSAQPGDVHALRELYAAITAILPPSLNVTWRHIPMPTAVDIPPTVRALTSLHEPLADQLVRLIGEAEHLRVITPFLDSGTLHRLATRLGVRDVMLDIPADGADTPLQSAIDLIPGLRARSFAGSRSLHAKAFSFQSPNKRWLAVGSANCTQAALERSVQNGGNLEFLVAGEEADLPECMDPFEPVIDVGRYSGTGRNWDEGRQPNGPIIVTRADYVNNQLEVEWALTRTENDILYLRLRTDTVDIACPSNPTVVPLADAPRVVMLIADLGDASYTTRAWVTDHSALKAFADRAHTHRWVERLVSEDPLQNADSINVWLEQGVLEFLRDEADDEHALLNLSSRVSKTPEASYRMKKYLEIFTFSPDPVHVRSSAEQFLASPLASDALAILRALLGRSASTTGGDIELDSPTYERDERRRSLAQKQIGESLIRHLERLARNERLWEDVNERAITTVLRLTFGAVASIGNEVVGRGGAISLREQLIDSYLTLLYQLIQSDRTCSILTKTVVAGPLVLSLGIAADLATSLGDQFNVTRLRKLATDLFGVDPRPTLSAWREECKPQAEILLATAKGVDRFSVWEALVLHLFGIASELIKHRLQQRWGLLLELQEADIKDRPERETLYTAAAAKYGASPVWQRYNAAQSRHKLPVVHAVARPICPKCFLTLADSKRRGLERGEAVICDCGSVLVLRT